jgi:hypothetical protein
VRANQLRNDCASGESRDIDKTANNTRANAYSRNPYAVRDLSSFYKYDFDENVTIRAVKVIAATERNSIDGIAIATISPGA